jgi:hypothetical protein
MAAPESLVTYERARERIGRFMQAIAVLGTAIALVEGGWKWAAGFFLGSLISGLNFRWLRRLVDSIGGKGRRSSVFFALRYLLMGGCAYAILRFTSINLTAVLIGLFVLTGAVFIEVLFEIIYGRK